MTKKSATKSDKEFMGRVAALGCIICKQPATIHHIRKGMGMGQRNTHRKILPLCHNHHQGKEGIHTLGTKTWQAKYGDEEMLLSRVMTELKITEGIGHEWFV